MSLRKWVLGAAAALLLTTPASAFDWGGFYAGVLGGFSHSSTQECDPEECSYTLPGGAAFFGYNWDQGDVIWGIDAIVALSIPPEDYWCCNAGDIRKLTVQKMIRYGVEVTDNAWVYGAAGGGFITVWDAEGTYGTEPFVAIAAGVEMALTDSVFWRTHAQLSHGSTDYYWDATVNVFSVGTGIGISF